MLLFLKTGLQGLWLLFCVCGERDILSPGTEKQGGFLLKSGSSYQELMMPFRREVNQPHLSAILKVQFLVLNKLALLNYDERVA